MREIGPNWMRNCLETAGLGLGSRAPVSLLAVISWIIAVQIVLG